MSYDPLDRAHIVEQNIAHDLSFTNSKLQNLNNTTGSQQHGGSTKRNSKDDHSGSNATANDVSLLPANSKMIFPAMVRAGDGQWHMKQHRSDSSSPKLSPRRGGELRDVQHSKLVILGPDPHRSLMKSMKAMTTSSQSTALEEPSPGSPSLSPQHGRRKIPSDNKSSSSPSSPSSSSRKNKNSSVSPETNRPKMRFSFMNTSEQQVHMNEFGGRNEVVSPHLTASWKGTTKQGSLDAEKKLESDLSYSAIPLDSESTKSQISKFEDNLIRGGLRDHGDIDGEAESRSDTPVEHQHFENQLHTYNNTNNNQSPNNVHDPHHQHHVSSGRRRSSAVESMSGDPASIRKAQNTVSAAMYLQKSASQHNMSASMNNNVVDPNRAWEDLSPQRESNPFFGVVGGLAPHTLRAVFLRLIQTHPSYAKIRAKGMNENIFSQFLSILAPNMHISSDLVDRCLSYFDCTVIMSSAFDTSTPIGTVKKIVSFPQIMIRYGANFSPRFTDFAIVAIFATFAGVRNPKKIKPNSAILLSDLKSSTIRAWCDRNTTANSIQRQRWLAVATALEEPETREQVDTLVRDVVFISPELERSDFETRLFPDCLPNGASLPNPPVITVDQFRYVIYGSERLLPLAVALRTVVERPEEVLVFDNM